MKATIVGNLGKDAEAFTTKSGKGGVKFSVAETVGWGDDKKTQWVNCTLWGERGNKLLQYLTKGNKIVVFGDVSVREYQDSNGCSRWSLDCNVGDVTLVGSKQESASSSSAPSAPVADDDIPF